MYESMVPDAEALSNMFPDVTEAGKGPGTFSFSCNEEESLADVPVSKGNFTHKECFGTFKGLFSNHSEKGCFFTGVKCEGHWSYIKAPCGAKIMVCEGLFHHITKMGFKPKEGSNEPVVKVFKGVGALGTTGAVIAPPPKDADDDDDDDDDDDSNKKMKGWKSWKERKGDRQAFFSRLPGAELWADDFLPEAEKKLHKEDHKVVASWRSTGLKGLINVIKKVEAERNHAGKSGKGWGTGMMTYDKLEGKWNETLAETGLSLLPSLDLPVGFPSLVPPPPPPPQGAGEPPKPTITCNEKPAWWHGAFPCIGKFEMEVEFEHQGIKGGDPFTVEIEAKCQGFWSGLLGRRCSGFSSMSKEWLEYEKWGQCSGKFGIMGHPIRDGFVMGNGCRGKSLGAFIVEKDDDDDDKSEKHTPKPVLTIA
eukprot:jgi/Botrbrau1/6326/Bobra.0339s0033.2